MYWRWSQAVFTAFLLVLAGIAWTACAPIQVGGQASYVIIRGVSMEPDFHYGDLVIVHQGVDYQVGDIAAYYNADINGNVFHRIVGLDLDRFIFKGDNNSWLDSYRPTPGEIIGKLWIHLPKVGQAITWMRVPLNMACTVGILGGVIMSGTMLEQPRRKGKKKTDQKTGSMGTGILEGAFLGLGVLFLASLALGIYAFNHPVWRAADPIEYEHKGTFSYSAAATPEVYDAETVQTGEPVFPALTCSLQLRFVYSLSGDQFQDLSGTHQLTARIIEEQSNWQRTIPLETETGFSGNSYTTQATLNLCQVETLVEKMEQATGFHPAAYTLAILPAVTIEGTFNGEIFQDTFEPDLRFKFDKLHFYLIPNSSDTDTLNPSKASQFQEPRSVPNRLSLFGGEFKVITLRIIFIIGLVLSFIGSGILVFFISNAARHDPDKLIRLKYGGLLVSFSGKGPGISPHPLEVASIDDLAKIAERNNSMILHDPQGSTHSYYVNSDGKTYRFVALAEASEPAEKPATKRTARGKDAR